MPEMTNKYRVGLIGRTGKGDYGHGVDTVWKEIDRAELVAVADENEKGRMLAQERTGAKATYSDYRKMLESEKLDILAIGPRWIDQHHEMLIAAADHGCHVYMEKPFCRNLTEADQIVQAFEMRHLKLAIAHQSRWAPTLAVARREIQNGLIGQVLEIRARGKEDPRRGGGEDLWVLGSHALDLMRAFAGDPASCRSTVSVNGRPAVKANVIDGNEGIGPLTGDSITASYRLPGHVSGYFASRRGTGGAPSRFGLQIFGSAGILEYLTGFPGECHVLQDPSWSPARSGKNWVRITSQGVGKPEVITNSGLEAGNVVAVNDLLDCIEHPEKQPRCSMYDGRWTVEMIAGIFESHRLGSETSLPLQNRTNPLTLL
jgi:predicted dehydrogenase